MLLTEPAQRSAISNEAVNKAFGRKFRELRRQRNISQTECGDLLDFSRVTIANMESGKQNIQLHQIFAIAQAFDVRVERLIPSVAELESVDGFQPSREKRLARTCRCSVLKPGKEPTVSHIGERR